MEGEGRFGLRRQGARQRAEAGFQRVERFGHALEGGIGNG